MDRASITIPAGLATSLTLPAWSLVDGAAATEQLVVHSLGASLFRRAVQMRVPLDAASSVAIRRTERLYRIRQYLFRPAMALTSLTSLVSAYLFVVAQRSLGVYPWWIHLPLVVVAIADEIYKSFIMRSALAQYPRREGKGVRISDIPEFVAQEIVRLNPGVSIRG